MEQTSTTYSSGTVSIGAARNIIAKFPDDKTCCTALCRAGLNESIDVYLPVVQLRQVK
ncbi:MAG: hypothetical protein HYS18_08505 [Burkholderiales bacterium]|nr:hypothetical protein [Burkholderiales bacterium]